MLARMYKTQEQVLKILKGATLTERANYVRDLNKMISKTLDTILNETLDENKIHFHMQRFRRFRSIYKIVCGFDCI